MEKEVGKCIEILIAKKNMWKKIKMNNEQMRLYQKYLEKIFKNTIKEINIEPM